MRGWHRRPSTCPGLSWQGAAGLGVPRTAALWSVCSCPSCRGESRGWRLWIPGSAGHLGTGVMHAGTWPHFIGKLRALAWELLVPLPHWAQGDLSWFSWPAIIPPSLLYEGPMFPSAPALRLLGRPPVQGHSPSLLRRPWLHMGAAWLHFSREPCQPFPARGESSLAWGAGAC